MAQTKSAWSVITVAGKVRRRLPIVWCLLLGVQMSSAWAARCVPLDGEYRVEGEISTLDDVLTALQARASASSGSVIRLRSDADGSLHLWFQHRGEAMWRSASDQVLRAPDAIECVDGWWQVLPAVRASRKNEQSVYLQGQSQLALAVASNGNLQLRVHFSGSERANLFSYESAHVSLPIPGSGVAMTERLIWRDNRSIAPDPPPPPAPAPEPAAARDLRTKVQAALPPTATLRQFTMREKQADAHIYTRNSKEMASVEDRLHAAGILYQVISEPLWSGNGWLTTLRIDAAGAASPPAWSPSLFRVAFALDSYGDPTFATGRPTGAAGQYRVIVRSPEGRTADHYLARLRANAPMFRQIEVVSEHFEGKSRVVEVGLRTH